MATQHPSDHPALLAHLGAGGAATISAMPTQDEHFARLRAMGLCEGRRIELIQQGSRLIVRLGSARIGLDRRLAERIEVVPE